MNISQRNIILVLFLSAIAIIAAWRLNSLPVEADKTVRQVEIPGIKAAQPIPPAAPLKKVESPAPISPNIVLYGTFINKLTQQALISIDDEAQHWLNPKQYINDNFYLDSIFKDHVIVRDSDNTMALEIRITNKSDAPELPTVMPAHAWVESLPPVPGIDLLEPNHYRIKRELILKELQSGEIFKQVKIVPEESGGFYVDRIRRGSMAEVVGLHAGDIINKINDKPLTSVTDVLDLYKNLDALQKVDIEITRSFEVQHLRYELN